MKRLFVTGIAAAVAFYRREPARCNAWLATLVGPLLLRVGLDVDDATVLAVVGGALNVIVGELTRALVTPTATIDALVGSAPEWDDNAGWAPENPDVRKP